MSYEVQSLDTPIPSVQLQNPAALPVKEFIGYDPNGHTTITGSERVVPDVKHAHETEGREAEASPSQEESITLPKKVSAIARREQAQRQREQILKQRELDLAAKLAKAEKFEKLQERLAAKDYGAVEELGATYEEYTNHLVAKQAEKNPQAEKLSKVEKELEALKKAQEESTIREYESNQSLWKNEISRIVASSDDYSAIKELGAEDLVLQHINDSFEEDDIELTAEQAVKEIEDALVERAEKLAKLTKIQKRFEAPPKQRLGAPKTITQNMTVSSQKPVRKPFHLMSDSEQIAEAYRRVQEAKIQR
jgi:hypothetical protein